jgi:pimeloyl-ACP methyl ester carboxylesterase
MTATRTVKVCGQELRVEVRPGSGTGTPLLICCGMGISYEVFDLVVDALDPGIAIIRVDVPGVGGCPVRVWPYGFPELARLLAVLLDALGYQRVDVLGFSWGGALAQQFAVQYRGRCRRLVLICTSPGLPSIPGRPQVVGKMLTPKRFPGGGSRRGPVVRGGHRQSR